MVEAGTIAVNAQVEKKAGANASATSSAEAYTNDYIQDAEGIVCSVCRFNFVAVYGSLTDATRYILREAVANLAAIYVIQYDMSGFTSRVEAEDMINILRDGHLKALSLLRDKKVQEFINS